MSSHSAEWFTGICPKCGQMKQVREFPAYGRLCSDCYFGLGEQVAAPSTAKASCNCKAEPKAVSVISICIGILTATYCLMNFNHISMEAALPIAAFYVAATSSSWATKSNKKSHTR